MNKILNGKAIDLFKFGLMPGFVGRLPIAVLEELDEDHDSHHEGKNSIKQYKNFLL